MDRLTIGVAAGVLGLVAAGLVTAAVLRTEPPAPDLGSPHGIVLAYARAEEAGDAAAAWDLLATSTQARADRDHYLTRVGENSPGATPHYLTTEREQVSGDEATVVLVRTYSGSGTLFGSQAGVIRTTVRLSREPIGWRISVPPDEYNLVPLRAPAGASA